MMPYLTEPYLIEPYALEILSAALHQEFAFLLNPELAETITASTLQRVALMQEYSNGKVWRKSE
jgi:hypothetical protein